MAQFALYRLACLRRTTLAIIGLLDSPPLFTSAHTPHTRAQVDGTPHSKAPSPQKRKHDDVASGSEESQIAQTRNGPVVRQAQSRSSPQRQTMHRPASTPQQRSTIVDSVTAQSNVSAPLGRPNAQTMTSSRSLRTVAQSANDGLADNCPHGFSSQEEDGDMLDGLDFDAAFTQ